MELILTGAVIFIGSFLQGAFGFAFVLFAMPLLSLYLPIKTVAPLIALFLPLLTGILSVNLRSDFLLEHIVPLLVGAALGAPLGIFLLSAFDDRPIKIALGVTLVLYSVYSLLARRAMLRFPPWTAGAFGAVGGVLGGLFNTSGPPVALYVSSQEWHSQQKRAALNVFVLATSIVVFGFHVLNRNITHGIVVTFLQLFPVMLAGMITGRQIAKKINEEKYKIYLFMILLVMGVMLLR